MKNGRIKRFLLAVLSLLLLATSAMSCSKEKSDEESTEQTTVANEVEDVFTYDENGFVEDRLSDDLDFKSQNLNMYHWQTGNEYVTDLTSDPINSALYYRVLNVQDRLNCFITIKYAPGGWYDRTSFIENVYNDVATGNPQIDIVSHYSFTAPIGAMYGLYENLNNVENLDLDMPWWIGDIQNSIDIDGKVYFATGDIAPNTTTMTYCMFFNADLMSAHGHDVDALYKDAIDGNWTIEKMNEVVKDSHVDENGNSIPDSGDYFGLNLCDLVHYDAIFYAADMKIVDKNNDGSYTLSRDFAGSKTITLVEECIELFYSDDCANFEDGGATFSSGHSLLLLGHFNVVFTKLKTSEFKYGVLPVPKYDETQSKYTTCLTATHSLYSVVHGGAKVSMAGAVMEALASDAYRNITPVLFEEGLKVRYAKDEKAAVVYDIIRESVVFDVGRIWGDQVHSENTNAFGLFRNAIQQKASWRTKISGAQGAYVECLNSIVSTITSFDH